MKLRSVVVGMLSLAACSNHGVNLENRPCATTDDCVAGYVCFSGVCVVEGTNDPGDQNQALPPDDEPGLIDKLDLGATFVVNAGLNVVNFPVRVALDGGHLESAKLSAGAANLRFVDVADHVLIAYELVDYEPGGTSIVWLQFPALSPSKTVQIGYGPADTPASADNGWADIGMRGVWHFDKGSAHDSSGAASDFDHALSAAADNFDPSAGQVLTAQRASTPALTIELVAKPDPASWSQRAAVAITPVTPQADFQVSFTAPGGGAHRVFDTSANEEKSWTELLDDGVTHVVWARVHQSGTANLDAYSGPASTFTEAGYTVVLDQGLQVNRWDFTPAIPNNKSDMDALFASKSYADANFTGAWNSTIDCNNASTTNCVAETGNMHNYIMLFEGWLLFASGSNVLGTASDDSSDILIGGSQWKVDGTLATSNYGTHPVPTTPLLSGVFTGTGLPVRFQYRFVQGSGNRDYHAVMSASSPVYSANDIVTTSLFRRKLAAGTQPVASISGTTNLGGVIRYGTDVTIKAATGGVHANVGGVTLDAPGITQFSAIAVTVAGTTATLYVNGTAKDSGTMTTPLSATALTVGDITNDAHSPAPTIDEVRFSTVARDAAWLSAQATGATVTFQ